MSVLLAPNQAGSGGMVWQATASLGLSVWVTATPASKERETFTPVLASRRSQSAQQQGTQQTLLPTSQHQPVVPAAHGHAAVYRQYADATGHAPPLREDAMLFWQSRNRYKSTDIALAVADRYQQLGLPVGVLVIDYENERIDGDFAPNPDCFRSLSALSASVRKKLNATTMFSFWPEAKNGSDNFAALVQAGCIINTDLSGYALDTTVRACREMIWTKFLKPRYYEEGVSAYWLDETDGEGTGIGNGVCAHACMQRLHARLRAPRKNVSETVREKRRSETAT